MINVSRLYCGLGGVSDAIRYARNDSDKNRPIAVYNCTSRCNLRCLHCYSSSAACTGDVELTTVQARKLLDELAAYRCPVVLFSGGEPLLRADIFDLIAYSKSIGLRTVLSTNGTLIDKDTACRLAGLDVSYVGVSIDGPRQLHDEFRGRSGAFAQAMAGIESCRLAGLRTGLRFTITSGNAQTIDDVFDIARQASVGRICFYHLVRTGRAASGDSQVPSVDQTRQAVDRIIGNTARYVAEGLVDEVLTVGNHADGPWLLMRMRSENSPRTDDAFSLLTSAGGNRTGSNIACINWDGRVFPDQFFRNYSLGNIVESTFAGIWDNPAQPVLNVLRNKSVYKDKRCAMCRWFEICRGNFRFVGGDPAIENWHNEPPCYLTDMQIGI